jgi:hypothetical protein
MHRIRLGLLAAGAFVSLIAWSGPVDASECPKIRYQIKYQGALLKGRKLHVRLAEKALADHRDQIKKLLNRSEKDDATTADRTAHREAVAKLQALLNEIAEAKKAVATQEGVIQGLEALNVATDCDKWKPKPGEPEYVQPAVTPGPAPKPRVRVTVLLPYPTADMKCVDLVELFLQHNAELNGALAMAKEGQDASDAIQELRDRRRLIVTLMDKTCKQSPQPASTPPSTTTTSRPPTSTASNSCAQLADRAQELRSEIHTLQLRPELNAADINRLSNDLSGVQARMNDLNCNERIAAPAAPRTQPASPPSSTSKPSSSFECDALREAARSRVTRIRVLQEEARRDSAKDLTEMFKTTADLGTIQDTMKALGCDDIPSLEGVPTSRTASPSQPPLAPPTPSDQSTPRSTTTTLLAPPRIPTTPPGDATPPSETPPALEPSGVPTTPTGDLTPLPPALGTPPVMGAPLPPSAPPTVTGTRNADGSLTCYYRDGTSTWNFTTRDQSFTECPIIPGGYRPVTPGTLPPTITAQPPTPRDRRTAGLPPGQPAPATSPPPQTPTSAAPQDIKCPTGFVRWVCDNGKTRDSSCATPEQAARYTQQAKAANPQAKCTTNNTPALLPPPTLANVPPKPAPGGVCPTSYNALVDRAGRRPGPQYRMGCTVDANNCPANCQWVDESAKKPAQQHDLKSAVAPVLLPPPTLLPPPLLATAPHNPPQPPVVHAVPQPPPPVHAVPVPPKPKKHVKRPRPQRQVQQRPTAQPQNHHDTATSAAVIGIIGGVIAGSVSRPHGPTYHRPSHTAPAPAPARRGH